MGTLVDRDYGSSRNLSDPSRCTLRERCSISRHMELPGTTFPIYYLDIMTIKQLEISAFPYYDRYSWSKLRLLSQELRGRQAERQAGREEGGEGGSLFTHLLCLKSVAQRWAAPTVTFWQLTGNFSSTVCYGWCAVLRVIPNVIPKDHQGWWRPWFGRKALEGSLPSTSWRRDRSNLLNYNTNLEVLDASQRTSIGYRQKFLWSMENTPFGSETSDCLWQLSVLLMVCFTAIFQRQLW